MLRDVHPIPDNPGIEQPGQAGVGAAVVGLPPAGTACACPAGSQAVCVA